MGTTSDEENQWRRTFCQVPFSAIYKHADKGTRSLQGLAAFFRRKAEAERGASEQLRELLLDEIGDLEEPGTGIRRALLELKGFVDGSCRQKLLMAQGEILNANNEYEAAAAAYKEAADRLHQSTMELREAKHRQRLALHGIGVPEFELQRLAARVTRNEEEQAQAVMVRARAKTTLYNRIVSRDEMTMAVSVAYQKAEEERLDQLNASLHRFLYAEKERLEYSQQMLTSLETHVQSLSRAEDIQLLIHNQRDPDNIHFQGKALALLDWQWSKTQVDHVENARRHTPGLLERRTSTENGIFALPTSSLALTAPLCSSKDVSVNTAALDSVAQLDGSPHTILTQSPISAALREYFVGDREHGSSSVNEAIESDTRVNLPRKPSDAENGEAIPSPQMSSNCHARTPAAILVHETCKTAEGRAWFVKCLNRQRSLETKVKDQASFEALVACFDAFLDECVRQDDIKAAKTAMILAETFYYPKMQQQEAQPGSKSNTSDTMQSVHNGCTHPRDDESYNSKRRTSLLCADCRDYTEHTNEELLQRIDKIHPLLHGEEINRGATRTYLQEKVKQHSIWKTPSFWEKALLLAIGEELQRTPQPCPWEELPSGVPKHDGLPSREEAVCRVHNIVFGQLGSFTLSMLEFDVPLAQIKSYVETMCDAYELTEDQRFLLRKNLQEIFATLRC
ncbi:unnamed protein product [Peronospora destructor]|uniref:SBF1/SBF2 domain-containing protein n=1 Tax=Peronospora destructor TaxID=86335 RepID=A0AAV0V1K4_9STRA|nr:unnamed protein product [Peronospora destructor]